MIKRRERERRIRKNEVEEASMKEQREIDKELDVVEVVEGEEMVDGEDEDKRKKSFAGETD